jgi:hypothetical protein
MPSMQRSWFTIVYLVRYKDRVLCERTVVRAFCTPHTVSSYRTSKPSEKWTFERDKLTSGNQKLEKHFEAKGKTNKFCT